jgi:hypothetical protein
MTTKDEFDRIAGAWLVDGPVELPDRVLDASFEEIHRIPRRRRLVPWRPSDMTFPLKLAAAVAVVVVAIAAGSLVLERGSSPPSVGGSPAQTAGATPTPARSNPAAAVPLPGSGRLEPGVYSTDLITPKTVLQLPCCFEVASHDSGLLVLGEVGLARYIVLTNPDDVFDPETGEPAAVPRDLASWLAEHPGLDVDAPISAEVAGLPAQHIAGVPRPDADYNANGELNLTRKRAVAPFFVSSDHRFRLTVVDAPDGPLLIAIVARSDRFEEFLPKAEGILDGVSFADATR